MNECKRVIVWGTGSVAAQYYLFLEKYVDVIAFVSEAINPIFVPDKIGQIPVIEKEELSSEDYDAIVVAAISKDVDLFKGN